eukprot:CAMPEP_0181464378 /NCGR_PEP_ID=MMETSP1110-20121109/35404_1 /TAXON_ID=174948 /ORGANISM="Symbiodinium sp., Strain CCMP421" /LENGTH=50 /DNA_ID=CAMNT_0023589115 /DNA_START=68 /DNA_END=220 /DNA_ORIENTATION=+
MSQNLTSRMATASKPQQMLNYDTACQRIFLAAARRCLGLWGLLARGQNGE